jgi:hypothetical protein
MHFLFLGKIDLKILITGVREHGCTRRPVLLLLYIIYIYKRKERSNTYIHPLHPTGAAFDLAAITALAGCVVLVAVYTARLAA